MLSKNFLPHFELVKHSRDDIMNSQVTIRSVTAMNSHDENHLPTKPREILRCLVDWFIGLFVYFWCVVVLSLFLWVLGFLKGFFCGGCFFYGEVC